jgi:hypothetical protein
MDDFEIHGADVAHRCIEDPVDVETEPDLKTYDRYVIAFSGGKDSLGCLLHLLERGVDLSRIELHHHLVDGREGSALMDWPITESYCEAIAKAFGIPLTFSHRVGGFEREMLRENAPTAPVCSGWRWPTWNETQVPAGFSFTIATVVLSCNEDRLLCALHDKPSEVPRGTNAGAYRRAS